MFSINTNVTSLQAENYLAQTQTFQNETINQVTSGLRIVNSGDDAAGLAIANADRSNEAVLTQGIQNASDGLASLQTADGGLNNISQLLDRARTLATESASGSFTGDRGVLNSEFQSVIGEVNRQAQAIGLNQGGEFAKSLNVFVGGGETSNGISAATNGSVSVNLSSATVDAKSLGLEGVQASGNATTDIGDGSSTSVQDILNNSSNQASISNNTTDFYFTGPGFSDTSGNNVVKVAVNLNGVTNANTLVTAINQAIQNAGNGDTQQATAFQNANINAAINVNSAGQSQLTFNSASTAFQVQGGDQVATSLLGSFSSGSTGNSAKVTATGATYTAPTAAANINLRITGAGLTGTQGDFSVALATTDTTAAEAVTKINTAIAANTALAATGITAVATSGGAVQFVGQAGQSFQVQTAGDTQNALGFGSFLNSNGVGDASGGTFNYSTLDATGASSAKTQGIAISINGGNAVDLGVLTGTGVETTDLNTLNNAIQGNATLRAAGVQAIDDGTGKIELTTANGSGSNFRVQVYGGTGDAFGFGASPSGSSSLTAGQSGNVASAYSALDSIDSSGAQASVNADGSNVYQFTGLTNAGDAQTLTLSAVDAQGNEHSLNVALNASNASTLDQALSTINTALQASNDSTLAQIVGVKQQGTTTGDNVDGQEGIEFLSATTSFKVSLGASQSSSVANAAGSGNVNVGLVDASTGTNGGAVLSSAADGTGSTADISNIATATAAVNQLANSVALLGDAQAAVGRGENLMSYATNLANSQLTNLASAESDIRDANMATASANLTKAQIQMQAGVAALAQANSAPQQILSLLKQ